MAPFWLIFLMEEDPSQLGSLLLSSLCLLTHCLAALCWQLLLSSPWLLSGSGILVSGGGSRCYPTSFIQESPLETAIFSLFSCSIFFIPCYSFWIFRFLVGWPCYLSLCRQTPHIICLLPFWVLSNIFPSFTAQQDLWRISHSSSKGQNTNRTEEVEDIVSIVTWRSSMVFKSCPTFPL